MLSPRFRNEWPLRQRSDDAGPMGRKSRMRGLFAMVLARYQINHCTTATTRQLLPSSEKLPTWLRALTFVDRLDDTMEKYLYLIYLGDQERTV